MVEPASEVDSAEEVAPKSQAAFAGEVFGDVELYRQMFDLAPDAHFVHDTTGRLLDANQAALRGLGYARAELLRLRVQDVDVAVTEQELERIWSTTPEREPLTIESSHRRKDGSTFPVEIRLTALRSSLGRYFLASARDMTARRQAEATLRKNERRLSLAMTATLDAVWEWDVRTGIADYSPRWFQMLGYEPGEMPMNFETWKFLCHPDDFEAAVQEIQRVLSLPNSPGYEVEFRMQHKDGSYRWILGRGNVVERDEAGAPAILSGTNSDITRQKRAEDERLELATSLRQAQKIESIGRLAGGVAHDFNNMLTVIGGNLSEVRALVPTGSQAECMIADAMSAVESAGNLTRQLLTFSRKQVIDRRVMNPNELVRGLSRMLERLLGEHLVLETVLAGDLGQVRVDPGQFEQILVNLCLNARDAMAGGGRLTIETCNVVLDEHYALTHANTAPGRYVMLAVSDTGAGMTEEVRERIFEPFFTTKEAGRGTGLGLPMVYGAMQQHEGRLEVYSEPGVGTSFKLYFPRVDAEPEHLSARPPGPVVGGTERIAVVEDQRLVRDLAVRVLRRLGYEVEAFDSGSNFLADPASERPFDLIFTDVVMPGINGRELADRIVERFPETKVLFASGYTENVIVFHGDLKPGIDFIAKPYPVELLARRIREVLSRSEKAD